MIATTQKEGAINSAIQNNGSVLRLLIVAPNSLDSNNGYHIQRLATAIRAFGAECVIAVPVDEPVQTFSSVSVLHYPKVLSEGPGFSGGLGPGVVHAWTPREVVRRFCVKLFERYSAKLLIHLEDNEECLTEASTGKTWSDLLNLPMEEQDRLVPLDRFHPGCGPATITNLRRKATHLGFSLVPQGERGAITAGQESVVLREVTWKHG